MSGYCQPRITSRHTRRGPGISAENSLGQTGATAMSSNVLASLVTDETKREHRAKWLVYAGGYGQRLVKIPHTASMRGHWPGYDSSAPTAGLPRPVAPSRHGLPRH